ncbi:hypothetical protein [Ardenticatena maritima]|nr:hypothetical protein [Ardenticatena maritima]
MNEPLGKIITNFRFTLRAALAEKPAFYFTLQRLRPSRRDLIVSKDTEIVIEGYPRSANTFAVAAFLLAQERPVKVAHHLHVPAQVIRAVQWGIPTVVLIRKPEDAIVSRLIRRPDMDIVWALRGYISFYQTITQYRTGFIVAPFEEVVSNFGQVIVQTNERFGTRFVPFEHTEENIQRAFALVEDMDMKDRKKGKVTETTEGRPSWMREELKARKKSELDNPMAKVLLQKARLICKLEIALNAF